MYHLFYFTVLLTLQSDRSLHMTHIICRLCCALAHIEEGFSKQSSVLVYIFYQVCAPGMVCGIVSGTCMCKTLYHTSCPTSVPTMVYGLWNVPLFKDLIKLLW